LPAIKAADNYTAFSTTTKGIQSFLTPKEFSKAPKAFSFIYPLKQLHLPSTQIHPHTIKNDVRLGAHVNGCGMPTGNNQLGTTATASATIAAAANDDAKKPLWGILQRNCHRGPTAGGGGVFCPTEGHQSDAEGGEGAEAAGGGTAAESRRRRRIKQTPVGQTGSADPSER
jgi:hypothetical protein